MEACSLLGRGGHVASLGRFPVCASSGVAAPSFHSLHSCPSLGNVTLYFSSNLKAMK